jgi:hypothetical protein
MTHRKPDLTPDTRRPYGPQRPSPLQLTVWIVIGLGVVALVAFFVFAALTFEGGGDDSGSMPTMHVEPS